jgi:hypothetical protein
LNPPIIWFYLFDTIFFLPIGRRKIGGTVPLQPTHEFTGPISPRRSGWANLISEPIFSQLQRPQINFFLVRVQPDFTETILGHARIIRPNIYSAACSDWSPFFFILSHPPRGEMHWACLPPVTASEAHLPKAQLYHSIVAGKSLVVCDSSCSWDQMRAMLLLHVCGSVGGHMKKVLGCRACLKVPFHFTSW